MGEEESRCCSHSFPAIARGGTPYDGLYRESPPERGIFVIQIYKRVGISLIEVYERGGKSYF